MAHMDLHRNRLHPKFSPILTVMYEDLKDALDWERRLPALAREFGQDTTGRRPLLIFGPRYLSYVFSPQARVLEASLRNYGAAQATSLPHQWQTHWPGRDHERLYLLLEDIESRNPVLRSESRSENSKAGIYHWYAGPVELDLILPRPQTLQHMDPRVAALDSLCSLVIARIGASNEEPVLPNLSFAEAIRSTQQVVNLVRETLGESSEVTEPSSPSQAPERNAGDANRPRRDVWIKA